MDNHWPTVIKNIRKELNLTQHQLADAIGVEIATVNRWENGHKTPQPLARRALERLYRNHIRRLKYRQNPSPDPCR